MDKYKGEKVLAIKNSILFKDGIWQGLKKDNREYFYNLINKEGEFIDRIFAETSFEYKQVIPYVLFRFKEDFFLYEYIEGAKETRLHHNYILGIAGHINPDDVSGKDTIQEGMMREWTEEVSFSGDIIKKSFLGILNDDRREVEKMHLGIVYIFEGNSPDIRIKESHKMVGKLMPVKEMAKLIGNEEDLGWAPLLYKHLKKV